MKTLKIIGAGLLALLVLAGMIHAYGGTVHNEVIRDCIKEYDAARATGDAASMCAHAGLVKEACTQAHDEKCAKEWAQVEKTDCGGVL